MPLETPLIAGNWKMHGLRADALARVEALCDTRAAGAGGTLAVFPPATLLTILAERLAGSAIRLGGQDCHPEPEGAFTGDIGAPMLADAGCSLVIVGHSERRHGHGEDDALVRTKAAAGLRAGLGVIVCVGETEAEREAGATLDVLDRQIEASLPEGADAERVIVAYEPVWAIGTGKTATTADVREAHGHLRQRLAGLLPAGDRVLLLYGGSVKPANAGEIMALADVDGVLVGGASLDPAQFLAIHRAGLEGRA